MNKIILLLCILGTIIAGDVGKACEYAKSHAQKTSTHYCARYVAKALKAGGFQFHEQGSAYKYWKNNVLTGMGYKEVGKQSSYKDGDITVTENNQYHKHGHIAIYCSGKWISDFVQRSEKVYREHQPPIHYYTLEN